MFLTCHILINNTPVSHIMKAEDVFVIGRNESVEITIFSNLDNKKQEIDWQFFLTDATATLTLTMLNKLQHKSDLTGSILIKHQTGHSKASCVIKSSVQTGSSIHLKATILIEKNCELVSSNLTMKGLLLDSSSTISQKPYLNIYTGNVSCGHGATVSGIPIAHQEYLASRGMLENQIKELYSTAFLV